MIGGIVVYPLPLDTISISSTFPFLTEATAVAATPHSSLGSPIVTVGLLLYPVPAELTLIFPIVLNKFSTNTT